MRRRRKHNPDEITLTRKNRNRIRKDRLKDIPIIEEIIEEKEMKFLQVTNKTKTRSDLIAIVVFAVVIVYFLFKR